MNNKILLTVFTLIVIFISYDIYWLFTKTQSSNEVFNPLAATYKIEGEDFNLINGKAEKEIVSDSASKIEVVIWGGPVIGDLNNDGLNDAALLLTYGSGGSGTFYYVVTAIRDSETNKAIGTNAIFLGDRIAPQNISINNNVILVNYADRKNDEPMTSQPSIGISREFALSGLILKEITVQESIDEQACIISGGTVRSSMCCESVKDFPSNCAIGACGCSSANSHEIKTCDCGNDKCFDGNSCASRQQISY